MCPATKLTLQCRLLSSREPRRTSKKNNWCWPTAGTHLSRSGVPNCITNRVDGRGLLIMNLRAADRGLMMKMMKAMNVSLWSGIAWLGCSVLALGQNGYKFDAATVSGLPARNIGSATMSGRVAAIDAVEQDGRITVFVGAASGGVWKSVNGGTTYKPVFDREDVQSIGAVAIDTSNSKTVWVGTGGAWAGKRGSVGG